MQLHIIAKGRILRWAPIAISCGHLLQSKIKQEIARAGPRWCEAVAGAGPEIIRACLKYSA
jgi:hypothetical protein